MNTTITLTPRIIRNIMKKRFYYFRIHPNGLIELIYQKTKNIALRTTKESLDQAFPEGWEEYIIEEEPVQ